MSLPGVFSPRSSVTKLRLRSFFEGKNPLGNSLSSTSEVIFKTASKNYRPDA